jgi:hypothetical protein
VKTYSLYATEFDRIHPSTDCVCERIVANALTCPRCGHKSLAPGRCDHCREVLTATAQVHAVRPLRPTLEDALADCEALNDEIAHLREVALRAQRREVVAVKRCEAMREALQDLERISSRVSGCFTLGPERIKAEEWYSLAVSTEQAREALKGRP